MKLQLILASSILAATSTAHAAVTYTQQSLSGTAHSTSTTWGGAQWIYNGGYSWPSTSSFVGYVPQLFIPTPYSTYTPETQPVSVFGKMNLDSTSFHIEDGGSVFSHNSLGLTNDAQYQNNYLVNFHLTTQTTVTVKYAYAGQANAGFGLYAGDYVQGKTALLRNQPEFLQQHPESAEQSIQLAAGDYSLSGTNSFFCDEAHPFGSTSFRENIDVSFSTLAPAVVPEPASIGLLAVGATALMIRRGRR